MRIVDAVRDGPVRSQQHEVSMTGLRETDTNIAITFVVTHDPHPLGLEGIKLSHEEMMAAIKDGTLEPGTRLEAMDGSGKFMVTANHELHQFQLRSRWHVPVLVEGGSNG